MRIINVDVALVPAEARRWPPIVCVVIDELRASSTITTLLDLGCTDTSLAASLREARRLGMERGSLLAGERDGRTPRGVDANNSPAELARAAVRGRSVVLRTTNGTVVISRLQRMTPLYVGCLLNARACAEQALREAVSLGSDVGIVCAGEHGRFALEDALTAGLLLERLLELAAAWRVPGRLSDSAEVAIRLRWTYPDLVAAFRASSTGRLLRDINAEEDLELCCRVDGSRTVPVVNVGSRLQVRRMAPLA
ncbi:MAG: 2-phosphosulfolactate phosphatase [Candidatus Dormibacteria bacterium]|jgi:2-phosphosulfolactate phosphatase